MADTISNKVNITRRQRFVIIAICLILGTFLFTLAYIGMKYGLILGKLNQPILTWMIEHRVLGLTAITKTITNLASPIVLASATVIVSVIWLYTKKDLRRPILLIGAVVISSVTSILLKMRFMDARPDQINMIPAFETDFSFPSGHTISATVFLLVLGYLIYSRDFSLKLLTIWAFVAMMGSGTIALSRLYLGYHWLTDVIASLGLGLIILAIVIAADYKSSRISRAK